jgi:hypothetical protein
MTLVLATLGIVRPDMSAVEALIGYSIALVAAENAWILSRGDRMIPWVSTGSLLVLAVLAAFGLGALSPVTLAGLAVFSACHFALLRRTERPARMRVALSFAFGLIHGFGFAGLLAELGLPTERLAGALLGFNLGVELGQLAVVLLVWPLLYLLAKAGTGWDNRIAGLGSAAICGLGVFWFVSRLFA